MNVILWILQVVLALVFAGSGVQHIVLPPSLPALFEWMYDIPTLPNVLIGVAELAAALGLILPGLTRIQTRLTPLAALGLAITMVGAVIFHILRGEVLNIVQTAFLMVLSALVAYWRWRAIPLEDRGARP